MTRTILKITSLILCVLLFASCKSDYKGLEKPLYDPMPQEETVSDGGLAARQGDWIYYVNGDNFTRHEGERFSTFAGALVRMKEDGSEKAIVVDKDVSLFSIQGETILLCIYENGTSVIASVKIDGTGYKTLEKIDDIYLGGCFGFAGEYIYYTKNYLLYRMDALGKNKTKITDFPVYNLRTGKKYSYFTKEIDESIGSVYKIENGSNEFVEITKSAAYVVDVQDNFAYYYILKNGTVYKYEPVSGSAEAVVFGGYTDYLFCEEEGFYVFSSTVEKEEESFDGLYKVPAGGGAKEQISSCSGRCMAYYNGYIYYVNATKLNQLYRCSIDGTVDECISEEYVYDFDTLDVVDNYLYFLSDGDYDRIYRLNMDNKLVECIEYDDISVVG